MEDYYIVLSPDFGLSPTEFVTVWNEDEECRAAAVARLIPAGGHQYDLGLITGILLGILTNVASSGFYDLMKVLFEKALAKRGAAGKHVHIEILQKPDGTRSFIVDIEER
jgi:hypothetical protein